MDFAEALRKIQTDSGVAEDELPALANGILGLAGALAQVAPAIDEIERNAAHRLATALGDDTEGASDGAQEGGE